MYVVQTKLLVSVLFCRAAIGKVSAALAGNYIIISALLSRTVPGSSPKWQGRLIFTGEARRGREQSLLPTCALTIYYSRLSGNWPMSCGWTVAFRTRALVAAFSAGGIHGEVGRVRFSSAAMHDGSELRSNYEYCRHLISSIVTMMRSRQPNTYQTVRFGHSSA